jgi:hypothetical protein
MDRRSGVEYVVRTLSYRCAPYGHSGSFGPATGGLTNKGSLFLLERDLVGSCFLQSLLRDRYMMANTDSKANPGTEQTLCLLVLERLVAVMASIT